MPSYFASPAEQDTTGGRGKTTRRKATKTVRGDDGAYCAQMKEEMLARPPVWMYGVEVTVAYPTYSVPATVEYFRDTLEAAQEMVTRRQSGGNPFVTYRVVRVLVRWVWENRDAVRTAVEVQDV